MSFFSLLDLLDGFHHSSLRIKDTVIQDLFNYAIPDLEEKPCEQAGEAGPEPGLDEVGQLLHLSIYFLAKYQF